MECLPATYPWLALVLLLIHGHYMMVAWLYVWMHLGQHHWDIAFLKARLFDCETWIWATLLFPDSVVLTGLFTDRHKL